MIMRRSFLVSKPNPTDYIFIYNDKSIYLWQGRDIPNWSIVCKYHVTQKPFYCFAESEQVRYLLIDEDVVLQDKNFEKITLRGTWDILSEDVFSLARQSWHLFHWRKTHRYCGVCGHATTDKSGELALTCTQCNHLIYPRISPCVIVLIHDHDRLLLARSPHFPKGYYSTIAGFVEPGEDLEEAIHREIMEEVGVCVKKPVYYDSQPWPFPDSLMIGFMAEYDSGEIIIDDKEIEDAQWFSIHNLPTLSSKMSISRYLIDTYLAQQEKVNNMR